MKGHEKEESQSASQNKKNFLMNYGIKFSIPSMYVLDANVYN